MSVSKKYSCLFGEVRRVAHSAPAEPITRVGEQVRVGAGWFRPLPQNCWQVWLFHPVLGPLGLAKADNQNLCDSVQKTRSIASSKKSGPLRDLEGRLLGHSVQTLWDLLGPEVQVLSGSP